MDFALADGNVIRFISLVTILMLPVSLALIVKRPKLHLHAISALITGVLWFLWILVILPFGCSGAESDIGAGIGKSAILDCFTFFSGGFHLLVVVALVKEIIRSWISSE